MISQPNPVPARFSQRSLSVRSPYEFDWVARSQSPTKALTGQTITPIGTTTVSVTASNGTTYSVTRERMARNFGAVMGIRTASGRTMSTPFVINPTQIKAAGGLTLVHRFVERGTSGTNGQRFLRIGNGSSNTARVMGISRGSSNVEAHLGNGSSGVTAATSTNPSTGNVVVHGLKMGYRNNGGTDEFRIRLIQYINGAASGSSSWSSWLTGTALISSGWATQTLWIGSRDGANDAGTCDHVRIAVISGAPSDDLLLPNPSNWGL
jgi:hypothetical protein